MYKLIIAPSNGLYENRADIEIEFEKYEELVTFAKKVIDSGYYVEILLS